MTDTIDAAQFSDSLQAIAQQVAAIDYTDTLKEEADDLRELHAGYFGAETGPDGNKWRPWYFRSLSAPEDHPTLFVTGRLKQSLIDGPDHIESVEPRSLTFGTSVPYSAQNQFGGLFPVEQTLIGRRGGTKSVGEMINIPARPHVGMTVDAVDQLATKIADATITKLKGE